MRNKEPNNLNNNCNPEKTGKHECIECGFTYDSKDMIYVEEDDCWYCEDCYYTCYG